MHHTIYVYKYVCIKVYLKYTFFGLKIYFI